MKKCIKLLGVLIVAFLLVFTVNQATFAQPPPPPPPSSTTGPAVPMDGGLGILLVLIGALGIKKLTSSEEEEE